MTKVLSLIFAAAQHLILHVLIAGTEPFESEDPIFWKYVRTAIRHWLRQWKAQAENSCEPLSGTGTI